MRGGKTELIGEMPVPVHVVNAKVPFYRQDGFKSKIGFIFMASSYFLKNPVYSGICQILGGMIGGTGILHGMMKSSPKHDGQEGLAYQILKIVMQLLNKLTKGKILWNG